MMKMKTLAAAIAFAAAGSANAAIELANTGNSSLMLTAWDNVAQESYIRDLGLNLADFQEAAMTPDTGLSQIFAADPVFAALFGDNTASNIYWNVTAADGLGSGAVAGRQIIGTAALGVTAAGLSVTNTGINAAATYWTTFFGNANTQVGPDGFSCTTRASCISTNTGDLQYAGDSSWGTNWSASLGGWNNAGTLGQSLSFWSMTPNGTLTITQANKLQYGNANGIATFTLAADGSLTYSVPAPVVSAVPVPAAAWLLGSGLIGMVGVARRRSVK